MRVHRIIGSEQIVFISSLYIQTAYLPKCFGIKSNCNFIVFFFCVLLSIFFILYLHMVSHSMIFLFIIYISCWFAGCLSNAIHWLVLLLHLNSLFKLILTISLNSTFYHRTFIIFIFFFLANGIYVCIVARSLKPFCPVFIYSSITIT